MCDRLGCPMYITFCKLFYSGSNEQRKKNVAISFQECPRNELASSSPCLPPRFIGGMTLVSFVRIVFMIDFKRMPACRFGTEKTLYNHIAIYIKQCIKLMFQIPLINNEIAF